MSKKLKIIFGIMFSFVFCFLLIGYASLTDTLTLSGSVDGDAQDEVFIVDIIDPTTNVTSTSYYANRLLQNITLDAGETASYYVQIYNSNDGECIFDNYYFTKDGVNVSVDEYIEESSNLIFETSNVISSFIDPSGFDYFKVTYTNTTDSTITVDTPIVFDYKLYVEQPKVELVYDGVTYVKYASPIEGGYADVTFDKVKIDLTSENNRVLRSNNGAILSVEEEDNIGTLTVSDITKVMTTNSEGEEVEKPTTCLMFSTLTSASIYNSGKFWDDKTHNNFIVLQNIDESIEPTDQSIEVWGSRDYSINLNSKYIHIYQPIVNDGTLKLYNESLVNLGSITAHDVDAVRNVFSDSYLRVENLNLTVIESTTEISSEIEYSAGVASYEGLVEIFNSHIYSEYGNGIYKRPADPGNMFRWKTSAKSKILVESSTVESLRNNAIRLYDGAGYVSLVDSEVKSCADPEKTYTKYVDPIFCDRHPLEKTDTAGHNYAKFYRYASTELMVYVTGGTMTSYSSKKVNHFYSNAELNSRIFYTKSAKFKSATDDTDTVIHARTVNDVYDADNIYYFPYPVAILNGNSATMEQLYEDTDETILSNHYLNSDGWYYIKTAEADVVSANAEDYRTSNYIENAEYTNMIHEGIEIRVGNPIEFINFNNPGTSYFDTTGYEGQTHSDYYMSLTAIPSSNTQAQYTGYNYEFILLASGDENYYNIVSLGNTKNVLHIENKNIPNTSDSYDRSVYSVGVKYISTDNQWVEPDDKPQRFVVMKYMHQYTTDKAQPYVFVSQYNSVLSFLQMGESKDYVSSIPAWQTTNRFNDSAFTDSLVQAGFIDAAYNSSTGVYTYSASKYLISNPTHAGYQRNGWYLWQADLYTEVKYDFTTNTNILNATLDPNRNSGTTVTLDSNAKVYISSQATKSDSRGIHLNSVYTNGNDGKDNFGYIRFTSGKEIYGIRMEVETINTTTNAAPSNTPYLQFRTYNKAGQRIDYEIIESNAPIGYLKPHDSNGDIIYDLDENSNKGLPYFVIIEKDITTRTYVITVLFDSKYSNYDLHSITLDPFDDANKDNTVTIKSITLIHPILNK